MGRIAAQQEQPPAGVTPDEQRGAMAAHSRSLRNNIISLAVFFVLVAALLFAVPDLRSAADHISDADVGWLLLAILLEILSCIGYVVLFDLVFGELGARLTTRLALAELAVNSVVSAGGLGGIALGAWILRTRGVSGESIARRSVLIYVLTSAVNVGAVVLIGVPMWLGLVAVDGGLFGMLVLFGAHPATQVLAAVVIYRAISLWLPALIGSLAFLSVRREIGKPLAPPLAG